METIHGSSQDPKYFVLTRSFFVSGQAQHMRRPAGGAIGAEVSVVIVTEVGSDI